MASQKDPTVRLIYGALCFLAGAVIGFFVGLMYLMDVFEGHAGLVIGLSTLVCGIAGAIFADKFWEPLLEFLGHHWRWWR